VVQPQSFPYLPPYPLGASVLQIIIPQILEHKSLLKLRIIDEIVGKHTLNIEVIVGGEVSLYLVFYGDDVVLVDVSSLLNLLLNTQSTFLPKPLQNLLMINQSYHLLSIRVRYLDHVLQRKHRQHQLEGKKIVLLHMLQDPGQLHSLLEILRVTQFVVQTSNQQTHKTENVVKRVFYNRQVNALTLVCEHLKEKVHNIV
jgi:hypothetical protein